MKKIYAKTLNPEDFDYRVYNIEDDEYNEVFILGGRDFCGIDNKGYLSDIKKLIDEYNTYCYECYYHNSIKEFLLDMLPKKENGKKLSPKEMHQIEMALKREDDNVTTCVCLSVITGKQYEWRYLRGYCQGDVVKAFYPNTHSNAYIDFVEAWYFGTGTEVEIHDAKTEPTCPEDVEGFTFYTATWKIEDLKEEIKQQLGYKPDDEVEVVLWKYQKSTYTRHDCYELED